MRYAKALFAVLATVASAVVAYYTDGAISSTEGVNIAIAGAGAVAVGLSENLPEGVWAYAKTYMAALMAGLALLASLIVGGLTMDEVWQIAVAVLSGAGVYAVKNADVDALLGSDAETV